MKSLLALCFVGLALTSPVRAQSSAAASSGSADAGLAEKFRQADTNGDGVLSSDEARRAGFGNFDTVDADHNGTITLFEIGEALQRTLRAWAADDTNGDGVVSEDEAKKGPPSLYEVFIRADTNGDHRVTREEYETYTRSQLYRSVDMPSVYPNIIDKRF